MPMPIGLRDTLRPGLIASAQKICRKMHGPYRMPCGDCLYTVGLLHSEFINVLPDGEVPRRYLCEEIMAAAMDG